MSGSREENILAILENPYELDYLTPGLIRKQRLWDDPRLKPSLMKVFVDPRRHVLTGTFLETMYRSQCPWFEEAFATLAHKLPSQFIAELRYYAVSENFWHNEDNKHPIVKFLLKSIVGDVEERQLKYYLDALKRAGCTWPELDIIRGGVNAIQ